MNTRLAKLSALVVALILLQSCNACRERYFNTLEKVGLERRELLVDRVESARDAQVNAQEQFKDALEQYQELVGHDGGDLERMYNKLDREYEQSKNRAEKVHDRIRKVRNVARSLFSEWQAELAQYQNATFRDQSERDLNETRARYDAVVGIMEEAAKTMEPVLSQLGDQVLFLKHNLNARALGSLQSTSDELQLDVSKLIEEMQASVAEADRFIADMRQNGG
jgi:ElaB/YqjD/DUF883 family membrane-anchored ribosome-binding protein